jgi:hypothetical protein
MSRIRNAEYLKCQEELNIFKENIDKTKDEFDNLYPRQLEIFRNLSSSIQEIEKFIKIYESQFPLSPDDHKRYRLLGTSLVRRYDLLDKLMVMCNRISKASTELHSINSVITDINIFLETNPEYQDDTLREAVYQ